MSWVMGEMRRKMRRVPMGGGRELLGFLVSQIDEMLNDKRFECVACSKD